MLRRWCPTLLSTFACLALPLSWAAQAKNQHSQSFSEHDIKAVYVYRLASFIRWPEGKKNNIKYCTLGQDETTRSLDALFSKPGSRGKLNATPSLTDAALHCDLLFITHDAIQPITPLPQYKGLLTISDSPNMLSEGGMIELRTLNYQIKPALHRDNIHLGQLTVSSLLLRIALLTEDSHEESGGNHE
ncbi:YfiR family protein [Photobacterium sp. DNB23_23_1]